MKRILVCDDERPILDGLRYLLRAGDREIAVAGSGPEALESIAEHVPDLLITDVMMPEMSGFDLVANLRSREETKLMPIIILTAKGNAQDAATARKVWRAVVMGKPFKPQELRDLVSATLQESAPNPVDG